MAIIGAGISGLGAAYHLKTQCPGTRFVILESKETFGGTWVTHRYPGIRSDSDLFTFGYRFKPWKGNPIATAEEILAYLGEVIDENGIDAHIRYRHAISAARWSSAENTWTLQGSRSDTGEPVRFAARFLWMCQGYYRHEGGYTPQWEGMDAFAGRIVHPQAWPEDLDVTDQKVVVIGSGATAATLIPAIAERCQSVTMLQRSPTFYIPARNANDLADTLRTLEVDEAWIHEITRRKVLYDQAAFTRRCFEEPEAVKTELLAAVRAYLGDDYDVETHFTPKYRPWRQRIAFIPDGDLFRAIRSGKASVVTDEIDRFTPSGILTKSGKRIEADIVVTATGFHLNVLGDIDVVIDGEPLDLLKSVTYRGMMLTGAPNLAFGVRLFPFELDASRRSGRRLRLPASQPHEGQGGEGGRPDAARRRARHAAVALGRPRGFQSRLPHARHGPVAETRRQGRVAPLARLLGRQGSVSEDRPRRRDARIRLRRPSSGAVTGSCDRRRNRARSCSPCSRRGRPFRSFRR